MMNICVFSSAFVACELFAVIRLAIGANHHLTDCDEVVALAFDV